MKIAILSLPLHSNYGGILQSYALSEIVRGKGHMVRVVSRPIRYHYTFYNILSSLKRSVFSLFQGKGDVFFPENRWNKASDIIEKNTNAFICKYIPIDSRKISQIRSTDYDAFIVGSDQVWRRFYFAAHESDFRNAFLKFAKDWNVKRMAYAASFGTDDWEYDESITKDIKMLVQKFDVISVREDSGIDICHKYLGVNAVHTLDPTLLLKKEDYLRLISEREIDLRKDNLLAYVLDKNEEKQHLIESIADAKSLKPLYVGTAEDIFKSAEDRIQPPVEEWLAGFRDAKFVVTDSYHACIFSILFNKPFVVVANKERGLSRFSSLLEQFNLMDHLLVNVSDYNSQKDYTIPDETYEILDNCRKESMAIIDDFLMK